LTKEKNSNFELAFLFHRKKSFEETKKKIKNHNKKQKSHHKELEEREMWVN
jgi:hypothetical protein